MESSQLSNEDLREFYSWPHERSFRLNMIITSFDSAVGIDGSSHSLTSAEDRRVLGAIREQSEVLIIGAQSIRSEGWFLPPQGRLAILSRTANIPWESCPDSSRVNVYPSVSAIHHSLQAGEHNILCEGGITTAQLVQEQIGFDHIALTRQGKHPHEKLPVFLGNSEDYTIEKFLTEAQSNMTFQYWRRAVEHL